MATGTETIAAATLGTRRPRHSRTAASFLSFRFRPSPQLSVAVAASASLRGKAKAHAEGADSKASAAIDDQHGPKLRHARGLRQGDPLSPYLFILAMDVLSRIFDIAAEEGHLTPLKGRQARLRLSLYADDVMIFTNPIKEGISCIMRIMKAFGEATGLIINMAKSSVATVRCEDVDMDEILGDFTGRRVSFPIQYLGLPLTLGRMRMVHLQYIQDRAKSKQAGWQGKLVNVAGWRELVKSVLSSLPVYLLTVIKASKQFLKEIDKLRKKFLWAGDGELTEVNVRWHGHESVHHNQTAV